MASTRFRIPEFQREYAWEVEDVKEFWQDLKQGLEAEHYFLGLIILTNEDDLKNVVDGQQRLLTLTLLASALFQEATRSGRTALAGRLRSTFLRSIDYESDEELPRLSLASSKDDATLHRILERPDDSGTTGPGDESVSSRLLESYATIASLLHDDLAEDSFKRLGVWADFITNRLYFATFQHPDPASAFRVFEIVNTRGKELTTADLLKSLVLSRTPDKDRLARYDEWQSITARFPEGSASQFVQYLRHLTTLYQGYVLPRDLYDLISRRYGESESPRVSEFMQLVGKHLDLYLQTIDPTSAGPAETDQLRVFAALNELGVLSVRPILLAMAGTPSAAEGMTELLRLVVRRIIVGNLGTGNVERRFGNAARRIVESGGWKDPLAELDDLNPDEKTFRSQLYTRSLNKNVLSFLRQSILQRTVTPEMRGYLFFIRPRQASEWEGFPDERASYWTSTLGNTFIAEQGRRPFGTNTWKSFKSRVIPLAVKDEWTDKFVSFTSWNEETVKKIGKQLATQGTRVWYPDAR